MQANLALQPAGLPRGDLMAATDDTSYIPDPSGRVASALPTPRGGPQQRCDEFGVPAAARRRSRVCRHWLCTSRFSRSPGWMRLASSSQASSQGRHPSSNDRLAHTRCRATPALNPHPLDTRPISSAAEKPIPLHTPSALIADGARWRGRRDTARAPSADTATVQQVRPAPARLRPFRSPNDRRG